MGLSRPTWKSWRSTPCQRRRSSTVSEPTCLRDCRGTWLDTDTGKLLTAWMTFLSFVYFLSTASMFLLRGRVKGCFWLVVHEFLKATSLTVQLNPVPPLRLAKLIQVDLWSGSLPVQVRVHRHGSSGPAADGLPLSEHQPVCGKFSWNGAQAAEVWQTQPADPWNQLCE